MFYNRGQHEEFLLTEELLGRISVPGFAKRWRENPIKLVSVLGFDGDRVIKLAEESSNITSIIPVVGFPSYKPGWQTRTLESSLRANETVQERYHLMTLKCEEAKRRYWDSKLRRLSMLSRFSTFNEISN